MGNQMCLPVRSPSNLIEEEDEDEEKPINYRGAILGTEHLVLKELSGPDRNDKILDELLDEAQQHNLELLKAEIKSDINLFILNNLLLSIQFYENFEKTVSSAKIFKEQTENQIASKLAPLFNDGVIHGERKCILIHGMPHELAKNYIYIDKREEALRKSKLTSHEGANRYRTGDDMQNCESIMPLEYILTWDNLEIYKGSEFDTLRDYEYSAAKGAAAINRFCMEEANGRNNISKGYVRLRCVDVPASVKLNLKPNEPNKDEQEYDYSHFSDFNEEIEEVRSESDVPTSDEDKDEEPYPKTGNEFLREMEARIKNFPQHSTSPNNKVNNLRSKKFPLPLTKLTPGERRPSGIVPRGYPRPKKEAPFSEFSLSESIIPQITTRRPTQDNILFENESEEQKQNEFFSPPLTSTVSNFDFRKETKSLPKLDIPQNQLIPPSSSGYESVSSAPSRGSSLTSEDVREKWRKLEVKKLWQFTPKRRKSKDPVPETCFLEVEVPEDSDDESSESDSSSTSNSTTSDSNEESNKKRNILEPKYQRRTYLDSIAFSSEFCSEFKQIGSQIGLSETSLQKASVIGTTIRCSVLYPAGLQNKPSNSSEHKDSFNFLYTFTPSIQSKCLPQIPLIWWKKKMLQNDNHLSSKWPETHQIELIESLGTNIIPSSPRSINNTQYENLQQTLEWQVGYAQAEFVLLNSFKSVHWRVIMFASLLYRAFLAPLGPLGVGLEHFRNAVYHMCHQEFVSWNDEQPGIHLLTLIQRVYASLSQGGMQNFFIREHNMLKNIPIQNTRIIQAELKKIHGNILVYFMFAIRNMKIVKDDYFKLPNLVKLYKIITTRNEKDLISWIITSNPYASLSRFGSSQGTLRKKKISKKRRKQLKRQNNLKRRDLMETEVNLMNGLAMDIEDKQRNKLRKKYDRWEEEKLKKEAKLQAEAEAKEEKPKVPEKKPSTFDLDTTPVKKFHYSSVRLALLLKFFIEHFIHMAEKSSQYNAYSQAAMYILHVENLCEILSSLETESIEAQEFKDQIRDMRDRLGPYHMREYIRSKNSKLSSTQAENIDPLTFLNMSHGNSEIHSSNITLRAPTPRELPDPPAKYLSPSNSKATPIKRLAIPNFMQSLRSLPEAPILDNNTIVAEHNRMSTPSHDLSRIPSTEIFIPRVKDPSLINRRTRPVKFVEKPTKKFQSNQESKESTYM